MNSVLSVTVTSQNAGDQPIMVLELKGRLDASSVNQLERALTDAQLAGNRAIVIEMSGLTYVSSSGLRVLLTARSNARKRNGDVFLCELNPTVREVFDMVGFTAVFSIFDTFEQAVQAASIVDGS